jgi:hypothetical protein
MVPRMTCVLSPACMRFESNNTKSKEKIDFMIKFSASLVLAMNLRKVVPVEL